jgi:hypothetical protein
MQSWRWIWLTKTMHTHMDIHPVRLIAPPFRFLMEIAERIRKMKMERLAHPLYLQREKAIWPSEFLSSFQSLGISLTIGALEQGSKLREGGYLNREIMGCDANVNLSTFVGSVERRWGRAIWTDLGNTPAHIALGHDQPRP